MTIYLQKTSDPSTEIKHLSTPATEIFKALNDINSNYFNKIFYLSPHETELLLNETNAFKNYIKG